MEVVIRSQWPHGLRQCFSTAEPRPGTGPWHQLYRAVKGSLYGAETWVLSKQDGHRLSIFERKILRRIYGPVMNGGRWRIRTNQELYQQCGENDIVKFCKLSRLRWAGHVIRQGDDDLSRRVLLSESGGKRPRGRPRLRWEEGVEEDVARLGCRNWKVVALNREGWRKLLKEAEAHPGL